MPIKDLIKRADAYKNYYDLHKKDILDHKKLYYQDNKKSKLEKQRKYRFENIDRETARVRRWRKENPDRARNSDKKSKFKRKDKISNWRRENQPEITAKRRAWISKTGWRVSEESATKNRETQKSRRHRIRAEVLEHYGGNPPKCSCCGESTREFLALDHTNGGGNKHRKELGINAGFVFYRWLQKNNYPEGFRVLCHNCNLSLGYYGYCPHATKTT